MYTLKKQNVKSTQEIVESPKFCMAIVCSYILIINVAYIALKYGIGENVGSGGSSPDDNEDGCPDGMYLCSRSRRCISNTQLCDAVDDCGDQEDESVPVCGK